MFGEPESFLLHPDTAFSFGLIEKPPSKRKKGYSFQAFSITEKDNDITVVAKIDNVEKNIFYKKDKLSHKENIFIAWIYLLTEKYENRKRNKKIATEYIKDGLRDELESGYRKIEDRWAFPYYLIAKYNLDINGISNIRLELYKFIQKPTRLFLDFYIELLRQEKNSIRKVAIAKTATKYYPTENRFVSEIADDLVLQGKSKECINYLLSVKKKLRNKKEWQCMHVRFQLIENYIGEHRYKEALEELKMPLPNEFFGEDYTILLRGIISYHQKKWQDAIKNFEKSITGDYRDTNISSVASYFLIQCYVAEKNNARAEQIINDFKLQEDEALLYNIPSHSIEEASDALKEVLKIGLLHEETAAKAKGMLAYLIYKTLPNLKRKLTPVERANTDKAISLVEEALKYHTQETFFNALYSNLLYEKKDFEKAMDYKLKSTAKEMRGNPIYVTVELKECSDTYVENYPNKVRELVDLGDSGAKNYIQSYGFDSDVGVLWKKKLYRQITDLYKYVKPYIEDYAKIGEVSEYTGGGLFEIGYSFAEIGNLNEAREVYEKSISVNGESSSALNNLAIIYEQTGDLDKAKSLIAKAKEMNKDDEIVLRNYARIYSGNEKDKNKPKRKTETPTPKKRTDKLIFDAKTGQISIGKNEVEIPLSSNQYQLCKKLFELPFGEWLEESDVVEDFYKGKDGRRSFYDAIRLTNGKVEQRLKIKKLFEYQASRVRIRKEGLE